MTSATALRPAISPTSWLKKPIDQDKALIGLLLAGDHAEQRGLAGAIGADQADFLAFLQGRGRLDKDQAGAVLLADIV
jgi:hypothetical protein